MPRLDELRTALRPVERAEQTVDAVTRIAEDPLDTPLPQALKYEVGDLSHGHSRTRVKNGECLSAFPYGS
jgi:hypothetical protein